MESSQEKAFLEAFESNSDALFRHAFFRVSDRERAFDLTQDTYLKAWDYIAQGGDVKNYKSFMYKILHNLIIDSYRKKTSRSLDELLENETTAATVEVLLSEGSVREAEEHIDEQMLMVKIREHIHELSEHYRDVLTLRFIDGFGTGEIAEMTGVSENVVSVRIHRGIAKLKALCNTQ